jgi:hypothetical protein
MIEKLNAIVGEFAAAIVDAVRSCTLDELTALKSGGTTSAKPKQKYTRHVGKKLGRPAKAKAAVGPTKPKAPRKPVSAKTAALRKLQGKYMGLMRGLKATNKYRGRAMRLSKKSGVAAAVKYLLEKRAKKLI